ncbi:cation transporter [Arthrobacter sp. PAMC25284]|uniref:cation transporter n=1 Tax=Arthrobacter sp. PAMC25284 TaxID=2861279 RepID=UPI001C626A46|nr:cation transporter [Arthrobacter sp. PAMC25284]QYF90496.1 cation transporter [Arthrobacter sp. PAMC25284]
MGAGQVQAGVVAGRQSILARRIRLLVAATIAYNVVEAVVAIGAGTVASSSALIGFGLDSVIEVSSAAAVAWQFSGRDPKARERTALRLIAVAFFALAAFVTISAVLSLSGAGEAEHSTVGIVLAAVSLAVMPFLSLAQRRAGRELGSRSAVADSRQTLLCTYLSGVLLLGLVLNSALGWSWADPVAALVIAAVALKEGRDAWKGESCCTPGPTASEPTPGHLPSTPDLAPALSLTTSGARPLTLTTRTAADTGGCSCCHANVIRTAATELRHQD